MNTSQALIETVQRLKKHSIEDYQIEAQILLCHAMNISTTELYTFNQKNLTDIQIKLLNQLVKRRLNHEPSAYITERKEFFGLDFYVNKNVLIPRPETEILVEETLKIIQSMNNNVEGKPVIVDIGTGCGAIAISIARNSNAQIYATDISAKALKVAKINLQRYGLEDRVQLIKGNLLENIEQKIDIVVANLPYINRGDIDSLAPEIKYYEPRIALDGGINGTEKIVKLLNSCKTYMLKNSFIIIEIGFDQLSIVAESINYLFPDSNYHIINDLNGICRALTISI